MYILVLLDVILIINDDDNSNWIFLSHRKCFEWTENVYTDLMMKVFLQGIKKVTISNINGYFHSLVSSSLKKINKDVEYDSQNCSQILKNFHRYRRFGFKLPIVFDFL